MTTVTYSSPGVSTRIKQLLARRETGVAIILAATIATVSIVNPAFATAQNVVDLLVHMAPIAIVACGVMFVIVTGEIDISVGSLMGLLAAVLGLLSSPLHQNWPVPVAVLATVGLGAGVGLINGVLVAYGRVPSIIVTLGMLTALRGVTEVLLAGRWIRELPPDLRFLGIGSILGIPVSLWAAAVVIAFAGYLAVLTPLGRRIYAVGSNPSAAPLAGVSPQRTKLFVFTLSGFLVGVATVISIPMLDTIESNMGVGFELLVVTAVVVGGTSISGGKGTLVGTLLGVGLMGIVRTALLFLKLGPMATYWERAIQGAFILIAVLADHLGNRREHR